MSRNADLPADIDFEALFAAAAAIQPRAYAPYSRFKVGAALLADDGAVEIQLRYGTTGRPEHRYGLPPQ